MRLRISSADGNDGNDQPQRTTGYRDETTTLAQSRDLRSYVILHTFAHIHRL
jgi:hypothetical protein